MSKLTQTELQSLRELILNHQVTASKLSQYADQCHDPEIKRLFQQGAQSSNSTVQKLMGFL